MSEELIEIDDTNIFRPMKMTKKDVWGQPTRISGRHYELVEDEGTKSGYRWVRRKDRIMYKYTYQEWTFYYQETRDERRQQKATREFECRVRFWSDKEDEGEAAGYGDRAMGDKGFAGLDSWERRKTGQRTMRSKWSTESPLTHDDEFEYVIYNIDNKRWYASWDLTTLTDEEDVKDFGTRWGKTEDDEN